MPPTVEMGGGFNFYQFGGLVVLGNNLKGKIKYLLLYSIGFPNRKHCSLINTSLIPMTFTLRVPADEIEGTGSYIAVMSGYSEESQEYRHREFEITPVTATLAPQSTQDIQVLRFNIISIPKPQTALTSCTKLTSSC
jgi:hypothetical protein